MRLQKRREQPSNHKKRISGVSSGSSTKRASCCNKPTFPAATWPGAQGWVRHGASTWPCAASADTWELPAAAQAGTAVSIGLRTPAQPEPASSSVQQQLFGVLQMLPGFTPAPQAGGFTCAPQAQQSGHLLGTQQVSGFAPTAPVPFARNGAVAAQEALAALVPGPKIAAAEVRLPVPGPTKPPAADMRLAVHGPYEGAAEVRMPVPDPNNAAAAADLASLLAELIERSQEPRGDSEEGLEHMLESELAAAALGAAIANQAAQSPGARSACFSERLAEALVADSCLFEDLEAVTSPCAGKQMQAQVQTALQAQIPAQASAQLHAGQQPGLLYSQHSFAGSSLSGALSGQSLVCSSSDDMTLLPGGSRTAEGVRNMPGAPGCAAAPSVGCGISCNQQQPSAAATAAAAALFVPSISGNAALTCAAGTAGSLLAPSACTQAMPSIGCYAQPGAQLAAPCTMRLEPAFVPAAAAAAGLIEEHGDRLLAMQMQVTQLQNTVQCLKQQLGI